MYNKKVSSLKFANNIEVKPYRAASVTRANKSRKLKADAVDYKYLQTAHQQFAFIKTKRTVLFEYVDSMID